MGAIFLLVCIEAAVAYVTARQTAPMPRQLGMMVSFCGLVVLLALAANSLSMLMKY